MRATLRAFLFPALISGCIVMRVAAPAVRATPAAHAMLAKSIDSMVRGAAFRNAQWGILIVDPATSDTLYAHNARRLFIPASNQKLVTTSVMLEQLGPEFRYRTVIAARGVIADHTLNGDLAVVGRGDPTASERMKKGDAMQPLRRIADSLWRRGVRRISGRIIAAGNAFSGPVANYGPAEGKRATYLAGVDELLFNEGVITLHVKSADSVGAPAVVTTRPLRTYPTLRNLVTTVDRGAVPPMANYRDDDRGDAVFSVSALHDSTSPLVIVRGQIAIGDSANISITQRNPDDAYIAALTAALADRGIVVENQRNTKGSPRLDSLFTIESVPLRDILPAILKPSQNQIAEVFLRTIGLEGTGIGTADSGRRVVERQFAEWKIPSDGFVIRDGSGLSRNDLISPEALIGILDVMRRSPNFDLFYNSLPVAGVDGTIRERMKGTPAEGNVHAKTGTAAMVRSLSGYVHTADGRLLEFSTLCNNWTVSQATVDRVADAIAVSLARMRIQ